ncbi:Na+/H+ antiporter subunit E [Salsipaludibacter albus]|uniref:Na+/H+ antiporter subunit E n=1 Tax=Salsipaludibacter albus TaxID=2849650 RepID=UPI001EE441BA|nr:Na+/H+ antiporter subunit E [Salsipaludibacter albus]MBY5162641.1 Na+/H+ antiporter subunit E [Salsipaludibacter albus]
MTDGDAGTSTSVRSRAAVAVGWCVVVWCALWGDISIANVVWGTVVGLGTLWLVPIARRSGDLAVRPLAALRFFTWFVWALVRASAVVAWEVVTPTNDINEGIVAVPLGTTAPGLVTLIANAISLTPGTLTLEVRRDPPTVYVHVLHLRALEDVRSDVQHLERLARATFAVESPSPFGPDVDPLNTRSPR